MTCVRENGALRCPKRGVRGGTLGLHCMMAASHGFIGPFHGEIG